MPFIIITIVSIVDIISKVEIVSTFTPIPTMIIAPISTVVVTPISVVEIITTVEMIHVVQIISTVTRIPAIVVAPIPTLLSPLFPRLSLPLFPFPLFLFAGYWFLFGCRSGWITRIGERIGIWFGGSRCSKYGF